MKFLNLEGLQHFYDKYIRPLKGAAYKEVANNLTTKEDGSVLDARQGKNLEDKKVDKTSIINSLLTTEEGCALDARQGKVLDDKISDINAYLSEWEQETLDVSLFAILSHWQVMAFDAWKEGNTIHFEMEVFTTAILQANRLYTINDPASTDESIRPKQHSFPSIAAMDASYSNATAGACIITTAGAIQINLASSKPYVFIRGEYRTD